jgi:hypothetical protein
MTPQTLKTLTLCTALILGAGAVSASGAGVSLTPETEAQIRAQLTEQGYDVAKIKIDDGMYEAYARKDGKKYEVYLNADLEVVKTEMDD